MSDYLYQELPKLGFGLMRLPTLPGGSQKDIDFEFREFCKNLLFTFGVEKAVCTTDEFGVAVQRAGICQSFFGDAGGTAEKIDAVRQLCQQREHISAIDIFFDMVSQHFGSDLCADAVGKDI